MGNFNRDSRNRERSQMHQTICSDCGKKCEVPFKPTNQRPVYCNECFENYRGGSRRPEKSGRGRDKFQSRGADTSKIDNQCKEQLDKLIARLDIIISILTAKKGAREVAKEVKKTIPKKIKKGALKKQPVSKKKK